MLKVCLIANESGKDLEAHLAIVKKESSFAVDAQKCQMRRRRKILICIYAFGSLQIALNLMNNKDRR